MPKAKITEDTKECPYCKGTNGYTYKLYQTGTQWMSWDGQAVNYIDENGRHGAYRCIDCGRLIERA